MFYTVFSTNLSEYMQWQSDLLEHSWQKVEQEGSLIRLVATDDPSKLPRQKYAECVATRLWDTHLETGDAYPIYNKPASLLEWLFRDRPEGTVLLLDPDCVFLRPVTRHVAPGFPAAQKWVNLTLQKPGARHPFGLPPKFSFLKDHCARVNLATTPVMIPTLIHTSDLRRVCARWLELCGIIRQHYRNAQGLPIWEADMYAYLAACAEYRLDHEPISLGICTNWRPADAPEAPIIHYCQAILDRDGNEIFFKYRYRPWSRIDTTRKPSQPYGNDLIAIINDYVDSAAALPLQWRPKRRDGVKEGRVLGEILLELPADGRSLWLNMSGRATWDLCDGQRTIDQIGSELEKRLSANGRDLKTDVQFLVEQLHRIGFLEIQ